MHEISLLENVRDILEQQARLQGFKRVRKISLEIGQLSCVEVDALRFAFDVIMKGTLAEQAELEIRQLQGQGVCSHCGEQMPLETVYDPCRQCGKPGLVITQGDEMKIKDLIVI